MNLSSLKTFAVESRRKLMRYVADKVAFVLAEESTARRSAPQSVKELEDAIRKQGQEQVIEATAYMWFNRFCALRFMDANHYTSMGVVSPTEGATRPEILAEAIAGNFDVNVSETAKRRIQALLSGETPSNDRFNDAYRILFIAACNGWSAIMPFLFEKIDDYTELLMPDDLLSANSILAELREAIPLEDCQDVELIGWLYQFYISEKKDQVFDGLKKNRKIPKEDIPAATELFTPHWIVQYMVENSLGRLWLENHPESSLAEQFQFYIKAESTGKCPKIDSPEEIRICDPCCGSGHTLVYAFDVLYAIYSECGYDTLEIPRKILANNLYGLELDPRAATLASFALVMKARQKHRRFLIARNIVQPHICLLRNVDFTDQEITEYKEAMGSDFFTIPFFETMTQFTDAENLGSLIVPRLQDSTDVRAAIDAKNVAGNLFLRDTHKKVMHLLEMSDDLAPRYHVVVTNPPYMGSKGMNAQLKEFAEKNYPDSKADLFAMFIERCMKMALPDAFSAMITMQSWMFLSSFEKLRRKILDEKCITTMAHLGARAFDTIGGEVVSTTSFVIQNAALPEYKGTYIRLVDGNNEAEKSTMLKEAVR
ncbi:MAG: BREX-1 system adenine-specific DNA-methyltransferase PglX [Victivallales bacterium]|nr:BREX-1 system adenine-specific DNA-methyltransferase PglX [Victivallales bacterium]